MTAAATHEARRASVQPTGGGRPLRVAQVVPSLRGGGLERLARDIAVTLQKRGYVSAVFCTGGLGTYAEELRASGVAVYDSQDRGRRIRGVPATLIRHLREFRPDVIHAHSGTWVPAAVAKAVLRAPRLVFTDHGRYPPEPLMRALVERWCWGRTDGFVTVSSSLAEYVKKHLRLPRDPSVILNGIDLAPYEHPDPTLRARLRAEWGIAEGDVVAMAIGRMAPVKNYAGLMRALARAAAAAPAIRLAILGTGPLEPEVRAQVAALGLTDRVHFLGFRGDVSSCLQAADLFVNSSLTEALPVSLLEAMAAGKPTVAPRIGGIPEALGESPAGIIVPQGDMDALGDALARIASEPALRRELGERARARVQSFSLEAFTSQYCALYSSVLKESA